MSKLKWKKESSRCYITEREGSAYLWDYEAKEGGNRWSLRHVCWGFIGDFPTLAAAKRVAQAIEDERA